MFRKFGGWAFNKIPRKKRKALLKTLSFIKVAKKEYEKMDKTDKWKADAGYVNLAKLMKTNVYPRLFEAMDRHGKDHVVFKTRGYKDFKVDIDGLVSMYEGNDNWTKLGNAKEDFWEPIIRICHSRENIHSYSKLCESLMDTLDELTENDMLNRQLCERAQRFGTIYERTVIIEKIKKDE